MRRLTIRISEPGRETPIRTITVPLAVIRVVVRLLPHRALSSVLESSTAEPGAV